MAIFIIIITLTFVRLSPALGRGFALRSLKMSLFAKSLACWVGAPVPVFFANRFTEGAACWSFTGTAWT